MARIQVIVEDASMKRLLKTAEDKFRRAARKVVIDYGAEFRRRLFQSYGYVQGSHGFAPNISIGSIKVEAVNWAPLTPEWLEKKARAGMSNRFYKATGQMQSAVVGRIEKDTATTTTYFVGMDDARMKELDPARPIQSHKTNKPRTLASKFYMNEYGPLRGNADSRPIYEPLKKAFSQAVRSRLTSLAKQRHFSGVWGVIDIEEWMRGFDNVEDI